jgi:hypothetical protein
MAISLNAQPEAGKLFAAYTSQVFLLSTSVTHGQPPAALQVVVKNNGNVIDTQYYETIELSEGSSTDTCGFRIDIKEIVQALFSPSSMLPTTFGASANSIFAAETLAITCEFTAWLPNSDNLLELDTDTVTSDEYLVINAVRYENESPTLDAYTASSARLFLTSKPGRGWTDLNASEYLYVWNPTTPSTFHWMFEFFSATGIQKSLCRSSQSGAGNKLIRKGVGGKNVLNTSLTTVIEDGSGPGLTAGVAYYEVYGSSASDGSVPITVKRRYYVDRSPACINYRLHFLNKFGTWDYLPILGQKSNTLKTIGDPYEASIGDDFTENASRRHSRNRGQVRGDKAFSVEVRGVTPATALWLRELGLSPQAYIEERPVDVAPSTNNRRFPIVLKDNDYLISDRVFVFDVYYSSQLFGQRT